jgi:hypothetical protein
VYVCYRLELTFQRSCPFPSSNYTVSGFSPAQETGFSLRFYVVVQCVYSNAVVSSSPLLRLLNLQYPDVVTPVIFLLALSFFCLSLFLSSFVRCYYLFRSSIHTTLVPYVSVRKAENILQLIALEATEI